ncbi:unnamed protein product [Coregonus sp. 'balchen']|nr:unnamed protein product [Coregonus sp. 'balchen']
MGWNLLGPLVQILLKKEEKNLPHCLAILTHLLEVCSPKELLVGLLEQVEEAHPDSIAETVILLLQPLQKVLLRLGGRKASSVGMALSTLLGQVARLPVPQTKEQEEDDVFSLCRCCSALLVFVRPFVEEAKQSGTPTPKEDELRTELLKLNFATEILLLCHGLLRRREVPGFLEEEVCYPKESLASLAYLLFVQHIAMDTFPTVFSSVFVLQCNMEYINLFLSRTEESRLQKGLDLYEKSLVRLEDNSLPVQLMELKSFFSVPQRTKALKVLQLSINKFDTEAKYKFFQCMLKTSHHAGVEGYIIKNIKNQIDFALKPEKGNEWFMGVHLLPLLHQVLCLPQGPETDLLQNLDRVMESLNLLRYLLIRDKEWKNQTGIWTELYKIEERFMKPLRMGLNMSKAHYEAELQNTKDNSKKTNAKESQTQESVCSLTVGNEKMPNMTPEMQLQVLHSALHTFDMIESVLARIEEIIEVKEKP